MDKNNISNIENDVKMHLDYFSRARRILYADKVYENLGNVLNNEEDEETTINKSTLMYKCESEGPHLYASELQIKGPTSEDKIRYIPTNVYQRMYLEDNDNNIKTKIMETFIKIENEQMCTLVEKASALNKLLNREKNFISSINIISSIVNANALLYKKNSVSKKDVEFIVLANVDLEKSKDYFEKEKYTDNLKYKNNIIMPCKEIKENKMYVMPAGYLLGVMPIAEDPKIFLDMTANKVMVYEEFGLGILDPENVVTITTLN